MNTTQRLAELHRRLGWDGDPAHPIERDPEFQRVARAARAGLAEQIDAQLGPFDARHLAALREVPRERFVRHEDVDHSAEDVPLPLDDVGLATISAPHAYLLSFRLVELAPGDVLVELGSGTGYGAALAAEIVGDRGRVLTIEIDAALHARARALLAGYPNVTALHHDAVASTHLWHGATKAICTFAVDDVPTAWLDTLPEGGRLVAPVTARDRDQVLMRYVRRGGRIEATEHGGVRYVKNRSRVQS